MWRIGNLEDGMIDQGIHIAVSFEIFYYNNQEMHTKTVREDLFFTYSIGYRSQ